MRIVQRSQKDGNVFDPALFISTPQSVEKEWIDYNGHLNMAYYTVLFDRAGDQIYEPLGLGPDYARERRHTTYTAEAHICYLRELHLGDEVRCTVHLLEYDEKRFRLFQEMYHQDGWLAATCETLTLHVDMSGPRVAPFPPDILERIAATHRAHASVAVPQRAGRSVALRQRPA